MTALYVVLGLVCLALASINAALLICGLGHPINVVALAVSGFAALANFLLAEQSS